MSFDGPFNMRPSSLSRTLYCTASIPLSNSLVATGKIEKDQTSPWAAEGIVSHLVRENCLRLGFEPHDFLGLSFSVRGGFVIKVDETMVDSLYDGIDWLRSQADEIHVEEEVSLDHWLPGHKGTVDAWFLRKNWLGVSDHKYGMRIVSAKDHEQQMAYGLALWEKLGRPEIEGLLINIDQPRAFGGREWLPAEFQDDDDEDPGRGMKFATVPLDELLQFGNTLRDAYNDVATGAVKYAPSPSRCVFCPAREANGKTAYAGCRAFNNWMNGMLLGAMEGPDGPAFPVPFEVDPEYRFKIVQHRNQIKKWIDSLKTASLDAAMSGYPDPGSKLVKESGGNRFYTSNAEAILVSSLGEGAFKPRELIGIPDAEKLLKPRKRYDGDPDAWEKLNTAIERPPAKIGLAPISDKREAYDPAFEEFEDLDDLD